MEVTVTGANGFVGARVCALLAERGVAVRAVVRREGTAPSLDGVTEHIGDFTDPEIAAAVVDGADALVTTVHPMGSDRQTQHDVGVTGTARISRAAAAAGVDRHVHVSTAAVYDRSPDSGDVDESSPLVGDDDSDYAVTKRDADAALAAVDGITRVLVRPPAILGAGATSVWNTLRPAEMRQDEDERHDVAARTFAWVHVDDLAALIADVATGVVPDSAEADAGPVAGGCTAVNVAGEPATAHDYLGVVADALGVDPVWDDEPAWTGHILTERARRWGWHAQVGWAEAASELAAGLG